MQASALSKILGQNKVKAFTEANNLNRKGEAQFACWAYRKNHHTYERAVLTDKKTGKKVAVHLCRCGAVMPEKGLVKKQENEKSDVKGK